MMAPSLPTERVWEPTKRQKEFVEIPDKVEEALYGGAAGGGKSEVLLNLPIIRGFYQYPRFKGILFRRTFPELQKSLIIRSETDGLFRGTGAEYNQQLRRWKWPSGAVLDFGYAEYEQDVRKYDTTEYNYMGFDELTSFTEFQYMYLAKSRVRTSDSNLPAIVRSATNPGNIGHGWVRARFIECGPYGSIIRDKITGQKRIFIQSFATDNKFLMEADPEYIRRMEMLPEAEKRAKLYGDWWTFSGQVFDDWRIEPFEDEPPEARHVIPAFVIPDYWPRILATDWGFSAMAWNGWFAAAPTGRAYLYREYTTRQTKISHWGSDIKRLTQGERLSDAVLCQSAWQNTGVPNTVAEQLSEVSDINFRKADNDRIGGKTLMQEYLRWKPRPPKRIPEAGYDPDLASRIMRINGPERYKQYLDLFVPEPPETNLPKLQVFGTDPIEEFGTAPEFIKTIPLCVYVSDTANGKNTEDVAEFNGDDPYDGGRYGIKAVDAYFEKAVREHGRVAAIEDIMTEFHTSGDQTRFYQRMQHFEAKTAKSKKPVRKFHGTNSGTNSKSW